MTPTEYLIESGRTTYAHFHADLVPLEIVAGQLLSVTVEAQSLDQIKKALYYGKPVSDPWLKLAIRREQDEPSHAAHIPNRDILHAVLGAITETAELGEILGAQINYGVEPDRTKLVSEIGDVFWYLALLCRAIGVTFEEVMAFNAEKLRMRFPDKFVAAQAIRKDIVAEDAAASIHLH